MSVNVEICQLTNGDLSVMAKEKTFVILVSIGMGPWATRNYINLTTRESVAKLREQCDLWLATQ